jgi:hypothetical protein
LARPADGLCRSVLGVVIIPQKRPQGTYAIAPLMQEIECRIVDEAADAAGGGEIVEQVVDAEPAD